MAGTIHAILLLAMPVVAGLMCLFGPRRKPSERRPLLAVAVAGGAALMTLMLNLHLCHAGEPVAQCLIGGASAWSLLTFPRSRWVRSGLAVVWLGIMFGLSVQYVDLVHGREWYGHPAPSAAIKIVNDVRLTQLKEKIQQMGQSDATVYPEGWLRQMSCVATLQKELDFRPYRVEVKRAWHSWYTRLFPVSRIEQDFWFGGGRLGDSSASIVLRDTP